MVLSCRLRIKSAMTSCVCNDSTQYRHPELDSGFRVWIADQARNDGTQYRHPELDSGSIV